MWKDIEFNKNYEISDSGVIRRKDNNAVLKGHIERNGYRSVRLIYKSSKQRFFIHKLVALYFIPNDDKNKTFVYHINGNILDNRVENLEWVTVREKNYRIFQKQQKAKKERKNGNKAIPIIQYDLSGNELARFDSIRKASLVIGLPIPEIACSIHEETFKVGNYIFKRQ